MTINVVNLVGYVCEEPDPTYLMEGKALCRFSIIVESGDKNNESSSEKIDLELWNKAAEIAVIHISKGDLLGVAGSLMISDSSDQEMGETIAEIVVFVEEIYLFEGGQKTQLLFSSILKYSILDNDYDEYEDEEDYILSVYDEYERYDTSVDYGYLNDMGDVYEHFHSLGCYE